MPRNITGKRNPNYVSVPKEELKNQIFEGLTSKELADHFDVSQNTITNKVKKYWGKNLGSVRKRIYFENHKFGSCKVCGEPLKKIQDQFCSNKCKFSDGEYNESRKPTIQNDENKKAVCKKCGYETDDYNNVAGTLTKHRNGEHPDEDVENLYRIEEKKEVEYLECPECDWKTSDIKNKSGSLTKHVKNKHGYSLDDLLTVYPKYQDLFKMWNRKQQRREDFNDDSAYVRCKICDEKLRMITNSHCRNHGITQTEYKEQHGKIVSQKTSSVLRELYDKSLGKCGAKFISNGENEIFDFLKNGCGIDNIKQNERSLIYPQEIDLYLPDYNFAIEFDGIYWHSENAGGKSKTYHLNKTEKCEEKGIHLIHVFEDEWRDHREIVKSRIKYILNVHKGKRVYARNCDVEKITPHQKNNFLNENHIQGEDRSSVKLGMFHEDRLVTVMTFSKPRAFQSAEYGKFTWEISRFASDRQRVVVGAFGKLFKSFQRLYDPNSVISYADRRYTFKPSNVYKNYGFSLESDGTPNYWYTDYIGRKHRFNFTKSRIVERFGGDPDLTEWENMLKMGYDRIWDCGNLKYVWNRDI